MKKLLLALLFVCSNTFAFDSSTAFNVLTMSYTANTSVYQRIVLSDAQKSQSSVNFSVDVKNGGGRPTQNLQGVPQAYASQTDSAYITVKVYDAVGTLIGSQVSQTYTLHNWGSNAGWSAAPGDNLIPWSTANVTYTGSLANARFIEVWMTGTDGAWWAGNYGPEWRTPTVIIGGSGPNVAYNPEFGIAPTSQKAQGWFNTSNTWAFCGVTSGNAPCVTNETSVTANMWGGGYSANGGSLAGQVGGYTSVLTTSTADVAATTGTPTAPVGPPPPAPTAIYMNNASVKILRAIPTTSNSPAGEGPNNAFDNNTGTKYLNFDKKNAGVTVELNAGRVVTGFTVTTANDFSGRDPTSYKLYGSNDGVTWTLIKQDNIALSESRFSTSSVVDVGNTNAYVYYFMLFPTTKAGDGCGQDCNSMQIAEITYYYDANSTVTSTATSTTIVDPVTAVANTLCCGASAAPFNANASNVSKINTFINRTSHDSQVYIEQIGNMNTITVQQTGTQNNYVEYNGNGSYNTVNINQSGNSSTLANYIELNINGNNNTASLTQQSTGGGKGIYATVNNSNNSLTIQQKDSGNHYAEVLLNGGNKTVDITQQGSGNHMARIELSGTPIGLSLTQSGSTQQHYSINYNCTTAGGCGPVTVQQGQ